MRQIRLGIQKLLMCKCLINVRYFKTNIEMKRSEGGGFNVNINDDVGIIFTPLSQFLHLTYVPSLPPRPPIKPILELDILGSNLANIRI